MVRSLVLFLLFAGAVGAQEPLQFNRDVRPILTDACFRCHGPAARKGGLRLDLPEEATKAARSGSIPFLPGQPEKSEGLRRILSTDESEIMPPPSAHKVLKPAEKEIIKKWIAQGAKYQKHWAFETPTSVKASGAGFIDSILNQRLQSEKLSMQPEAERSTLIRRVSFALTGLPPSLPELDQFLKDTQPGAYERMVDRYLASKHYGEEMSRHWLDVARYADTHGLHLDNERQTWLYRDWVVKAFNDNLSFDRFTIEQLAGDLLPNATNDQLIATGFNRCNVTTAEGGSIDAEWVFRNAVDRTSTMMQAWMGLTGGCAVCHDHKFDPISAKEFYGLYAFFYSAAGPALDGNKLLTEPVVRTTLPQQKVKMEELAVVIEKLKKNIGALVKELEYLDPAELKVKGSDDLTMSFRAWVKQQGGKDAGGYPQEIKGLLKQAQTKISAPGEQKLREYYLERVCIATKPVFVPFTKQLDALTKQRDDIDKAIPGSFIFQEMPKPRDAFVMMRGQYTKPGDKVEPSTPKALPPIKTSSTRANRLDLAKWLVEPDHPLTARVTVNRFWQQLFGTGLVKSSDDFGTQSEPPSHPELLDALAVWYQSNGWDTKKLVRLLVTSQAFRQSSKVTPELWKRDPENRLLARGPRFRLDAEQIRDNALFASGLMNFDMGGKGVRPYQPPRIWEPVAFSGSNTGNYKQDTGSALYRRSLYTFLKRTAPPPYLANFDAPNREQFCSRRERSNTPLQALQLMNDIQHFEAARALGQRMLTEGGESSADRIRFAYRVLLSREPSQNELTVVERVLGQNLDRFKKDPEAAKQAIRVGESIPRAGIAEPELAAYTLVANLLLNLDETVTRN